MKSETPHATENAACAHRRIIYVRINHEGGTCSDSWECADCKCRFVPQPHATGNTEPQKWINVDGITIDFGDGSTVQILERLVVQEIVERHNAAIERARAEVHQDGWHEGRSYEIQFGLHTLKQVPEWDNIKRKCVEEENKRVTHIMTLKMDEYRRELATERQRTKEERAVSSEYRQQLLSERQRREQAEKDCIKSQARMSERKSVHQWLTTQGIPEEENGKRICLLRRLRITLDRLSETENEVDELKSANRGLYIESNERYQQLLSALAAIDGIVKHCEGRLPADSSDAVSVECIWIKRLAAVDLSALQEHDEEVRRPLVDALSTNRTNNGGR